MGLSCKEIKVSVLPLGIKFSGNIYRCENPDRIATTWDAHKWNKAANHRYTEPGSTGVYAGIEAATAEAEIAHYGAREGRVVVSKSARLDNVLDVTNPDVREQLGVTLEDITGNDYEVTHALGRFAVTNGYDGILAPSARNPSGSNIIAFGGF